jgi:hypothetical protein
MSPDKFHHGFGTHIRNTYDLWAKTSPINQWFQKHLGLSHGDDLSGIVLQMVWAKVRNAYFDPFAAAEKYRRHWIDMGMNPLAEKKLP